MKNTTALKRLDAKIEGILSHNPKVVKLFLRSNGEFEARYHLPHGTSQIIKATLRGTVMPGPVLTTLSEKKSEGYECNRPVPVHGFQGSAYELEYVRIYS